MVDVSVQELADYLQIDELDEVIERNLTRTIKAADAFLRGAVREDLPEQDPRVKELALIVASDLYDQRGLHQQVSVSNSLRLLVSSLAWQLRLEEEGSDV